MSETSTVQSHREEWSATGLLVKSITGRFSVGARTRMGRSTYVNEDFRWNVSPGIEANLFPYSESSRRSLPFQALMNVRHWDYAAPTIVGETSETRPAGSPTSELKFIQPRGSASVGVDHTRYLHDTARWQATINGSVSRRLYKGLSLNVFGYCGWIRDQLYLEAGELTEEQVLLRQRALATSFSCYTSIGLSYRFGSVSNNVLDPRFGGSSEGGVVIIM